jgi:hypothetical protein
LELNGIDIILGVD